MVTRWYEAQIGRFTTRDVVFGDPLEPASLNQFAYGQASPVTYWDPDGMYVRKSESGGSCWLNPRRCDRIVDEIDEWWAENSDPACNCYRGGSPSPPTPPQPQEAPSATTRATSGMAATAATRPAIGDAYAEACRSNPALCFPGFASSRTSTWAESVCERYSFAPEECGPGDPSGPDAGDYFMGFFFAGSTGFWGYQGARGVAERDKLRVRLATAAGLASAFPPACYFNRRFHTGTVTELIAGADSTILDRIPGCRYRSGSDRDDGLALAA
jgi:hypothetical protein